MRYTWRYLAKPPSPLWWRTAVSWRDTRHVQKRAVDLLHTHAVLSTVLYQTRDRILQERGCKGVLRHPTSAETGGATIELTQRTHRADEEGPAKRAASADV
eukprot:g30879.t1